MTCNSVGQQLESPAKFLFIILTKNLLDEIFYCIAKFCSVAFIAPSNLRLHMQL